MSKSFTKSLKDNRIKLRGKVDSLVLCKGELFYMLKDGSSGDSIYRSLKPTEIYGT